MLNFLFFLFDWIKIDGLVLEVIKNSDLEGGSIRTKLVLGYNRIAFNHLQI